MGNYDWSKFERKIFVIKSILRRFKRNTSKSKMSVNDIKKFQKLKELEDEQKNVAFISSAKYF